METKEKEELTFGTRYPLNLPNRYVILLWDLADANTNLKDSKGYLVALEGYPSRILEAADTIEEAMRKIGRVIVEKQQDELTKKS